MSQSRGVTRHRPMDRHSTGDWGLLFSTGAEQDCRLDRKGSSFQGWNTLDQTSYSTNVALRTNSALLTTSHLKSALVCHEVINRIEKVSSRLGVRQESLRGRVYSLVAGKPRRPCWFQNVSERPAERRVTSARSSLAGQQPARLAPEPTRS